jgi:hypothetical protein
MKTLASILILVLVASTGGATIAMTPEEMGATDELSRLLSDQEANQYYGQATSGSLNVVPLLTAEDMIQSWELPGLHFSSDEQWTALSCSEGRCRLVNARLVVQRITKQPYDGNPTPGQALHFWLPEAADDAKPVAGFSAPPGSTVPDWLRPRPVTTYFDGRAAPPRPPSSPGSMEAQIELPDGRIALLRPAQLQSLGEAPAPASMDDVPFELSLLLTVDGRHQFLGGFEFDIAGPVPVSARRYLRWAGDLDLDGKLDVLIEFSTSDTTHTVLFLSSLAKGNDLVGEAAVFSYAPVENAGC